MSTTDIEDAVKSALTCMGVEQKSYECLLDYNVEGYLFMFPAKTLLTIPASCLLRITHMISVNFNTVKIILEFYTQYSNMKI